MTDLEIARERLTVWIRDYGDQKAKEFIGDLSIVLLAAEENKRLTDALRNIVEHQEMIGGGLAVMSTTRLIAQKALAGLTDEEMPTIMCTKNGPADDIEIDWIAMNSKGKE